MQGTGAGVSAPPVRCRGQALAATAGAYAHAANCAARRRLHLRVGGVLEGVEYLLQRHRLLGLLVDRPPDDAIGLRQPGWGVGKAQRWAPWRQPPGLPHSPPCRASAESHTSSTRAGLSPRSSCPPPLCAVAPACCGSQLSWGCSQPQAAPSGVRLGGAGVEQVEPRSSSSRAGRSRRRSVSAATGRERSSGPAR